MTGLLSLANVILELRFALSSCLASLFVSFHYALHTLDKISDAFVLFFSIFPSSFSSILLRICLVGVPSILTTPDSGVF